VRDRLTAVETELHVTAKADLSALRGLFASAARNTGEETRELRLAGREVRLCYAGIAMVDAQFASFAHVEAELKHRPDLTVHIWDSHSTGTAPPALPPTRGDNEVRGTLYYFGDATVKAAYQPGTDTLSVFDSASGEAWYWTDDARRLPYWDRAEPIRQILHWWLDSFGAQRLHAGAVGTATGGVVIVGKSGSGKSTTALSALASRLDYAGDDCIAVVTQPEPFVYSLYNAGKLHPEHLARFEELRPTVSNAGVLDYEKAIVYIHEHFPEKTAAGFPLSAVLLPTITGGDTRLVPVSPATGLAALAPSTILQLPPIEPRAFSAMARLVKQVPSYRLELGPDVRRIPEVILELIEQLA
jgi:hypothetical protein